MKTGGHRFSDIEEAGVEYYRLTPAPVEGEILEIVERAGLRIALFETAHRHPEWRILLPDNPVPIRSVSLIRHEGPRELCGVWREFVDVPLDGGHVQRAIWGAHWELLRWSRGIPRGRAGYDKCSYKIVWQDGGEWGDRYDLESDYGDAMGASLPETFNRTVLFYSGLMQTPSNFEWRGNDRVDPVTARRRYRQCLCNSKTVATARKLLAAYEL